MKKKYLILPLIIFAGLMFSCDDYLDKAPDNRAEIDSEEKVKKLLVSAYSGGGYPAFLFEMFSDNTDLNEGPWDYYLFQEDAFAWKDIINQDTNDDPFKIWQWQWGAASAANTALDAIEEFGNPVSLDAARAEAYMCRAYAIFTLSTVYCDVYGPDSDSKLGLPYPEKPETEVNPQYERGTLTELYKKIDQDIENALPLIDDNMYAVPKYHFNKKAAYAFAARFNLYYGNYEKAIRYASYVLGDDPSSMLRDWRSWGQLDQNTWFVQPRAYSNEAAAVNLMNLAPNSFWGIVANRYIVAEKFFMNTQIAQEETFYSDGPWGTNISAGNTPFVFTPFTSDGPKVFLRKYEYENFSYPGIVIPVFTTEDLLMTRAEAYAISGDLQKAIDDMAFLMATLVNSPSSRFTLSEIVNYYKSVRYYEPLNATAKKRINPVAFSVTEGSDLENVLQYILHVRRIVNIQDGTRWIDIKRYGIEIYRRTISLTGNISTTDFLSKDDKRRVTQIPAEVLSAGFEPNPR